MECILAKKETSQIKVPLRVLHSVAQFKAETRYDF